MDQGQQAGPDHAWPGIQQAGQGPLSADEFLARLADEIDDRVAELLDEREASLPDRGQRLRLPLVAVGLLAALAATVVLRHNVLAACTVWPSTAIVYLAATRLTRCRSS